MAARIYAGVGLDAPRDQLSVHVSYEHPRPTIVVEGELVAPDAQQLSAVAEELLHENLDVVLDLTAMTAVDLAGVSALRALADCASRSHTRVVVRLTSEGEDLADDAGVLAALGEGVVREVVA
jgi:ABC-type transporter Mla MlaB component